MPFQIGDFRLPTLGDAVNGAEATLGNLVEGIVEGVTGEKVELTPGVGVDNTRVEGDRGKGEVKFDKKMASHDDMERLRRELEKELTSVRKELTKSKVRQEASRHVRPAVMPPQSPGLQPYGQQHPYGQQPQQAQGMNPMMMMMLARDGGIARDPLMLMMLMQSMGTGVVGQVNGQPLSLDPMAFASMQLLADALSGPGPVRRASPSPTP